MVCVPLINTDIYQKQAQVMALPGQGHILSMAFH